MVTLLHALALLLYTVSTAVTIRAFVRGGPVAPRAGTWVAAAALAAHGAGLAAYTIRFGELPLVGLGPSLSAIAFLIGGSLLATFRLREAVPLGLVGAPIAGLLVAVALWRGVVPAGEPLAFQGLWFSLHVVAAFVGYAALAVAFAAGLLYLLQFRELKGKRFGRIFRFFPPLETLDRVGQRALEVGFPALTLALILGWAWTVRFRDTWAADDPQVIWGGLTWLVFLAMFVSRSGGVGGDRRGALASVVGFLVVVLAYVLLRAALADGGLFL